LPTINSDQIRAIAESQLSMDALVRETIHRDFRFRFVITEDYRATLAVEKAVKQGGQAGQPRLNPQRKTT
jgi:hypothetical protein